MYREVSDELLSASERVAIVFPTVVAQVPKKFREAFSSLLCAQLGKTYRHPGHRQNVSSQFPINEASVEVSASATFTGESNQRDSSGKIFLKEILMNRRMHYRGESYLPESSLYIRTFHQCTGGFLVRRFLA